MYLQDCREVSSGYGYGTKVGEHVWSVSHVLLSGGVLRVPGPEAGEEVRRGAPADLR